MVIQQASGATSLIDVLDRVLDKGIVIDAWVRVSLVGIELVTVEARIVVASISTYLGYSDALATSGSPGYRAPATDAMVHRPRPAGHDGDGVRAEWSEGPPS